MLASALGLDPTELDHVLAERRRTGLDRHDEIWEGELHMAPHAHSRHGRIEASLLLALTVAARPRGLVVTTAFNLGRPDDFRVPDLGVHEQWPDALYVQTLPLVVEVLSPGDDTFRKLDFYAASGVRELLVADGPARRVRCLDLQADGHPDVLRSSVLDVTTGLLTAEVDWP